MATYYVRTTGNDTTGDGSDGAPLASINSGINLLSSGDTLMIGDGTYDGVHNTIHAYWQNNAFGSPIPSGTSNNPTTIKAENNNAVTLSYWDKPLRLLGQDWMEIEGIRFNGKFGSNAAFLEDSDYIKILRCAFYNCVVGYNTHAFASNNSNYLLVEESWAWGTGRYMFHNRESDGVVFRRCVARHDYQDPSNGWGQQIACFTRYDSRVNFLNCIAIDSFKDDGSSGVSYGAIWNENNAVVDTTGDNLGCIVLNCKAGRGAVKDDKSIGTRNVTNCVFWDCAGGYWSNAWSGDIVLDHCTIGSMNGTYNDDARAGGIGFFSNSGELIKNSIILGCNEAAYGVRDTGTGVSGQLVCNNNSIYNNTTRGVNKGYPYAATVSSDANEINDIDPLDGTAGAGTGTDSLKHLVQIEANSDLEGAASDAGDVGATILKKIGTAGSFYGQAGWNTETADDLWPFPNESDIRSDFRTFDSFGIDGTRGFCADNETLTHYIWNYLGQGGLTEPPLVFTTTSMPDGTKDVAYSQYIYASGGTIPFTFTIASGTTSVGLSLATDGLMSGTPTEGGVDTFTVLCTDAGSNTANQELTVTIITANPLDITTTSIGNGSVNVFYSEVIVASGGTSPFTFTVASGTTPNGISLATSGLFSGTPTVISSHSFDVLCTDSDGTTDNQTLTMDVTAAAATSTGTYIKKDYTKYNLYVNGKKVIEAEPYTVLTEQRIGNGNGLAFYATDNSTFIGFKPPAVCSSNLFVLPSGDGSSGHVLATDGGLNLYWRPRTGSKSLIIADPADTSDYSLWRIPEDMSITNVNILLTGATGDTCNGFIDIADTNGQNAAAVSSDASATAGTNLTTTTFTANANTAQAGQYLQWHTTAGTGDSICVTIDYTAI